MLEAPRYLLALTIGLSIGCSSSGSSPLPDTVPASEATGGDDAGADSEQPEARFPPGTRLDKDLSWEGYAKGESEPSTIRLSDFHDPDGSRGIHALLITQDAFTCDFSYDATREMHARWPEWQEEGIELLQLVVYDYGDKPATVDTAHAWKDHFKASWGVGADPNFTFHEIGHNPLPIQIVVDPRTLTVVARANANDHRMLTELEELAEKNR